MQVRLVVVSSALVAVLGLLSGCNASPSFHGEISNSAQPSPSRSTSPDESDEVTIDGLESDDAPWLNSLPAPSTGVLLSGNDARTGLSLPWKFIKFGATRDVIEVAYVDGDGNCVLHKGFYVARRDSGVVVASVSRQLSKQACSDKVILGRAWLALPKPVGESQPLMHAPRSPGWSASGFFG